MAWRRPGDKPLSEPMIVIVSRRIYASLGLNELSHWSLGDLNAMSKMQFSILFYWLSSSDLLMIMASDECHRTLLIISHTLVQVMACCHQATHHYLSQCWPRLMSQYGITRPKSVNSNFTTFMHFIERKCCILIGINTLKLFNICGYNLKSINSYQ